ncbi:MAG: tetratricopeptide repeat protein [Crocinitomix sp.]|nr:tetratricopeptide repeat protein [Crocinitomix sp.]
MQKLVAVFFILVCSTSVLYGQKKKTSKFINEATRYYAIGSINDAISALDDAIAYEPTYAKSYFLRATFKFENEDLFGGVMDCNSALKYDPKYAEAKGLLGRLYVDRGDYQKGIEEFTEAIQIDSTYVDAWLLRAAIYEEHLIDEEAAILDYKMALSYDSERIFALYKIASLYADLMMYEETVKYCTMYIEVDQSNANSFSLRGTAQFSLENFNEGILDCEKAIELSPNSSYAYVQKAIALTILERYEESNGLLESKMDQFSDDYRLFYQLGYTNQLQGNFEKAILYYTRGDLANEMDKSCMYARGVCKDSLGDQVGACEDILSLVSGNINEVNVYIAANCSDYEGINEVLGNVHFDRANQLIENSDYERALQEADSALIYFQDPSYLYAKGYICMALEQYDTAITCFNKSVLANDGITTSIIYAVKGESLLLLGQFEAAKDNLENAVLMDSQDYYSLFQLGVTDHELGNYQASSKSFLKVANLVGSDAGTSYYIALNYIELDDKDNACKYLKKAEAFERETEEIKKLILENCSE